jgi:hypothetical protein
MPVGEYLPQNVPHHEMQPLKITEKPVFSKIAPKNRENL